MTAWIYFAGVVATFVHWCRAGFAQLEDGRRPSPTYEWFMAFMTLAWPVYWAGKLLWMPAQLLLPPPGEDVP